MKELVKKNLEKQGYRFVGNHSAIKLCSWCKKSMKENDVCYKNTFYGIQTWRCIQSSVSMDVCTNRCQFCWRDIGHTSEKWTGPIDDPKIIVDGLIKEHVKYIQGMKGNDKCIPERLSEAFSPLHIAISLSGEAVLYPKLPELIDEIHERGMTTFLVTNGCSPEMMEKLLAHQPTQVYVTVAAPDKETYLKTCRPLIDDQWERMLKSLEILPKFKRSTIRMTLSKDLNLTNARGYAKILNKTPAKFIELKAAMVVGYARYRLPYSSMPRHSEIMEFAKKICSLTDLKIIDQKENSRVVLLMKKDFPERIMKF
ncbi:MAG: 4-demethylwyosine synthase TYW1 [Nanoarchaeota archaeon]|nr:4-demethylwyosine synthase TYW1 [Nanoarchaeota archaeon]